MGEFSEAFQIYCGMHLCKLNVFLRRNGMLIVRKRRLLSTHSSAVYTYTNFLVTDEIIQSHIKPFNCTHLNILKNNLQSLRAQMSKKKYQ